jgi:hypothetical protein
MSSAGVLPENSQLDLGLTIFGWPTFVLDLDFTTLYPLSLPRLDFSYTIRSYPCVQVLSLTTMPCFPTVQRSCLLSVI